MKRKLVIDADPGIGDALAIAMAIRDPDFDLIGVTAVPGCVSGEMALLNAQAVVSLLDPPLWPRLGVTDGRACNFPREAGMVEPVFLHGETGLGDVNVPAVELHHRIDAAKLLAEIVRENPGQVTLLTLGPLTNVMLAADRSPDFLMNLKELVVCGGAMGVSGNVTAAAEFNIYCDPAAAEGILSAPCTKTIAPLDVTTRVVLSFDQYDRLKIDGTTRLGRLIEQTAPFALRAHRKHLGQEGWPLSEAVALASIARPRLFERRRLPVAVEQQGRLTTGMTIFDRRKKAPPSTSIDVLTSVDTQGVLDYLAEHLKEARGVG
ncbi:MAG: nucleoside hydrolase [Planctomycetaceae bacterium]|nr:nucleoside hydrolase [Planctomycetaceae bacterium]